MIFRSARILCPFCGKAYDNPLFGSDVTCEQRNEYLEARKSVQKIFPHKSAEFRESLISGICESCAGKFFG